MMRPWPSGEAHAPVSSSANRREIKLAMVVDCSSMYINETAVWSSTITIFFRVNRTHKIIVQ